MTRDHMVEGLGGLAAVSALAPPGVVNPRTKPFLRLPASDEINIINPRTHDVFPTKQIVRKIREAERMRSQMSSPKYHQEVGANFIQYGGGFFRGWYNSNGQIYYLPDGHDTRSAAENAARRCLEQVKSGTLEA